MTQALIAFGANLGDAQASLKEAANRVADHPEIEVVAVAKPLVTVAVSGKDDDNSDRADLVPDYLNSCLLYTSPSPRDGLLSRMPSSA